MAFGKEIKRLRELSGLSVKKIADSIGINSDRLKQWEIKDLEPKYDDRILIEEFFEMPINEISLLRSVPNKILKKINTKVPNYTEKTDKMFKIVEMKSVPVYDVDFRAGFVEQIRDRSSNIIASLSIPDVQECDYIIRAKGDSMKDLIHDKDWIGIKKIENIDELLYNEIYAIVTSEFQIIKYIQHSSNPGEVILASANKEYPPYPFQLNRIIELYIVRTVLPFSKIKNFI